MAQQVRVLTALPHRESQPAGQSGDLLQPFWVPADTLLTHTLVSTHYTHTIHTHLKNLENREFT